MPSRLRVGKKTGAKVAGAPGPRQRARPADDLQTIPGVGPSIAQDLRDLGIRRVTDLRRRDPERLYLRLIALRGAHQDRCLLYVFRCAVYYASSERPRRELLDWWRWKDRR
jgi:Pathogenicity locus